MNASLAASCVVFGLILLAHLAKIVAEGRHAPAAPLPLISSASAAGMFGWGLRLR